jgi:S1-C subfamily serine protease
MQRQSLSIVLSALIPLLGFPGLARSQEGAAVSGPSGPEAPRVENSIVKVFSRRSLPDCQRPWTTQAPQELSGSGVVIEGNRILTNAHVAIYSHQLQIQDNEAGEKITATVEAIAPGIDLAVLKLEDESFFADHPPINRVSALPDVKASVMAYGYPTGGNSLSITKGIVSRIEFAHYSYNVSGLRIQIDAAINPGNSGGPILLGDQMIGLAYSTLGGTQNIGYIIPNEEIDLFLSSLSGHVYAGKPMLYDALQTLESAALRKYLKLGKAVHGLVVTQPAVSSENYPLKKWDVIVKIGDAPLDDQGQVKIKDNVRVSFDYLIQKLVKDGQVPLTIVREGQEKKVGVPVSYDRPQILKTLNGAYPSYFIYGPLVFSTATEDFLQSVVSNDEGANVYSWLSLHGNPLLTRRSEGPGFAGEELVLVASPLFPDKLSQGYDNPMGEVVDSINGIRIKNLRHLVEVLKNSHEDFITIAFAGSSMESLVFPRAEALAETDNILGDNGIRKQGSPDVLELWNEASVK